MSFKDDCRFRTLANVCNFKAKDCSPTNCDMYNIEFSSVAIKQELDKINERIRELGEEIGINDKAKMKRLYKAFKNGEDAPELDGIEQKANRLTDLGYGKQYMEKALKFCKRAGL